MELCGGFVKADVSVFPDAKHLNIHTAGSGKKFFIVGTFRLRILGLTVGHVGAGFVDIDVVKEVLVHKIAVGLRIFGLS